MLSRTKRAKERKIPRGWATPSTALDLPQVDRRRAHVVLAHDSRLEAHGGEDVGIEDVHRLFPLPHAGQLLLGLGPRLDAISQRRRKMAEATVLLDRNQRDHGLAVAGDLDDVRFCFLDGFGKVAGRLRDTQAGHAYN